MTVREEVWPTAGAYLSAVRGLRTAFPTRPDLAGGVLRDSKVPGFPWSASGANAIVFSLTTGNGHRVAVRCFTRRPPSDVDERYRALGGFLRSNPCPEFAGFEWMDSAIIVDAKWWPILRMEWIDGDPLKPFVRNHLERRSDIEQLSATWMEVAIGLEGRGVAHGDLQHGNVIVSSSSSLRLVDLDGVWCPSTAPFASAEVGLPAYQHPERIKRDAWDHRIDRFSAIVIYVSLRAIASARRPVDILSPGDSLVLSADDIKAAAEQNARDEAWEFLLKSPDREVCLMADELHAACRRRLDDVPSLEEVVRQLSRPETPPPPPPPPGAEAASRAQNTWPPPVQTPPLVDPVQTPPLVDNVWNATGAPTRQDGKRVKVEASHQLWGAGAEPPRRTKPEPVPQSWSGIKAPRQPATGPAKTGTPTSTAGVGKLAIVAGIILIVVGILLGAPGLAVLGGCVGAGGIALRLSGGARAK